MRTRTACALLIAAGLTACATSPELVPVPCPPPPSPPADLMQPPARTDYTEPFDNLMKSIEQLEQWLKPSETQSIPPGN